MEEFFFDTEESSDKGLKFYVLVIYDISSNRRRTKLAKLMKSFGFRVQKSSFEARLEERKYVKLLSELRLYVENEDSIRVYKIRGKGAVTVFGKDDTVVEEEVIII